MKPTAADYLCHSLAVYRGRLYDREKGAEVAGNQLVAAVFAETSRELGVILRTWKDVCDLPDEEEA